MLFLLLLQFHAPNVHGLVKIKRRIGVNQLNSFEQCHPEIMERRTGVDERLLRSAWCKNGTRTPEYGISGPWDGGLPSKFKSGARGPLKFINRTPGPPAKFKSRTLGFSSKFKVGPQHFTILLMNSLLFSRTFYLFLSSFISSFLKQHT